jgi:hypothetical protein
MRSSYLVTVLAIGLAVSLSACAAIEAQRHAEEVKKQAFVHRVDMAHIYVTTGPAPSGKQYSKLGDLKYTVPFSPDAIDSNHIRDQLKKIAYAKWPDTIDAIVNENSEVSSDGSTVTVTAEAIQYSSSVDREALHHMNEGIVASPSGD